MNTSGVLGEVLKNQMLRCLRTWTIYRLKWNMFVKIIDKECKHEDGTCCALSSVYKQLNEKG